MDEEVINSILDSTILVSEINYLPAKQGIYAYFLNSINDLGKFGKCGEVLYVGLAQKSLYGRDTLSHLASGKTGWSSFRRSLGAILKEELVLTAVRRDLSGSKLRADKYKFTEEGEAKLTEWMMDNLKMGYWVSEIPLPTTELRILEERVILQLKPKLDLDRRTRMNNPLASHLDVLRGVCREEVKRKFK